MASVGDDLLAALWRIRNRTKRIMDDEISTTAYATADYDFQVAEEAITAARARAEPEEHCGCTDDRCPTWEHGYRAGTEAQREPAGGRTT